MRAYERLLKYVTYSTQSDESVEVNPSTKRQFELAHALVEELRALGAADAECSESCYVYASLPASPGCEGAEAIGFIAHMDTSPDFSGEGVKPRVIPDYDGGDVELGCGRTLAVSDFPHLPSLAGRTLITASGDTLLGADDKAGIAEIMTLLELLASRPHGPVAVCFTPDEEVGRGVQGFEPERFKARAAFTADGGPEGEVSWENFNASAARVHIRGFNVHPASGKDTMINAAELACRFAASLPADETPRQSSGREGFYHLTNISGGCGEAELGYILRDFDFENLRRREQALLDAAAKINAEYGESTVSVDISLTYRNMAEKLLPEYRWLIDLALDSVCSATLEPVTAPTRGGTDGAMLSWRGLPCPNLGTGGYAFHGPYEHITAEGMDRCVEVLLGIVERMRQRGE